jgi:hypothetical protein
MRRLVVVVLLPAVLLQGCASTATPQPGTPPAPPQGAAPSMSAMSAASSAPGAPSARSSVGADPAKLKEISDDLAGEPATVELTSGEVVQKAQSVNLGTEVTSWREPSGRERTVPTAEVRRVLREQRRLIGKGFGYGAAAGILPGYLVANNAACHRNCGDTPLAGAGAFVAGVLVVIAGGLVGMLVAAGTRHQVVVYAGPGAAGGAAAGAGAAAGGAGGAASEGGGSRAGELHCRLASPTAGGGLECEAARHR